MEWKLRDRITLTDPRSSTQWTARIGCKFPGFDAQPLKLMGWWDTLIGVKLEKLAK